MKDPEATVRSESRFKFWFFALAFYGIAFLFAVPIALRAQAHGVPTWLSLIYGAFGGAMASYFICHYVFRVYAWSRRQFRRMPPTHRTTPKSE